MIEIPTKNKPCILCKKYDGNPIHSGVCNVCKFTPKNTVSNNIDYSNLSEGIGLFIGSCLFVFLIYFFFGGYFENSDTNNSRTIDCSRSEWSHSKYCNGTMESEIMEDDFRENNFYNNTVR